MYLDSLSLSLLPSSSGTTSSLLGGAVPGASASGVNPILALQSAVRTEKKSVAAVAAEPQTSRELAAFRKAVATAKTPADLLANPDARKVLLTANGLGDQSAYTGLANKALLSDTAKPGNLASKLSDTRWLQTAKTYDFAHFGLAILRRPDVLASISNGYAEVQWRKGLDASTPGLSKALDFRDRAGSIKSALQVLGDPTFREVVTTALGIPKQIAFQSIEAQELAITSRIDLDKFKSPAFVEQFTKRFLIAAGNASPTSSTPATGITGLFA